MKRWLVSRRLVLGGWLASLANPARAFFNRAGGGSAAPVLPTITGVFVAGSSTAATGPANTPNADFGVITATTTDSSTPTFSLTGANSQHYQIVGGHLEANSSTGAAAGSTTDTTIVASGVYANSPQSITPTITATAAASQTITAISLTNNTFVAQSGNANTAIGTATVTLSPSSPPASGIAWTLTGADASLFRINSSSGMLSVGPSDVATIAAYHVNIIATNASYFESPFTQAEPLNGTAAALFTVANPTDPVSGLPLTRPIQIWNSGLFTEFASAAFVATINNPGAHTNDYLDISNPTVNGGNAVVGPWYLNDSSTPPSGAPITNATVHVPSVPGLWWNSGFLSAPFPPRVLPSSTVTDWTLRLHRGDTGAVIASQPVKVDILKRTTGPGASYYFPYLRNPRFNQHPIDLQPTIAPSSALSGLKCPVVAGSAVGLQTQVGALEGRYPAAQNTLLLQYQIDSVDVGAPVLGPVGANLQNYTYPLTIDTTAGGLNLSDGTHALGVRVVDYTGGDYPPYWFLLFASSFIVHNGGGSVASIFTGPQTIPVYTNVYGQNTSPGINYVTFPGTGALPLHNSNGNIPSPYSGVVPPATSDSRYNGAIGSGYGPELLRNAVNYISENLAGGIMTEYLSANRFWDNRNGGVFAMQFYPETPQSLEGSADLMTATQVYDGARDDCIMTQICDITEGFDSSGNATFWLVAQSGGCIAKHGYDGSVKTLAGWSLSRATLPIPGGAPLPIGPARNDYLNRMTLTGVIDPLGSTSTPSFGDLVGCHDIKYDPRDSTYNTAFLVNVLHQCIIRITHLNDGTTPRMVRYAGQYNGLGGVVTGTPFRSNQFQDGVATEFIAGSTVATFTGTVSGGVLTITSSITGSSNLTGCPLSWGSSSTQNTATGNMITTGSGTTWNTNFTSSGGSQNFTASTQVALFDEPYGIEVADGTGADPAGTLYVSDFNNFRLRKIDTSGNVTTLFGSQDGVVAGNGGVGWFGSLPAGSGALTNADSSPRQFPITSLSVSGTTISVTTSRAVQADATQGFAHTYGIQPYWTVAIRDTGNSNLDFNVYKVLTVTSGTQFTLDIGFNPNPGSISLSAGNIYAFFQDVFAPTDPAYRPWLGGVHGDAYFPWVQRLVWSSANPGNGGSPNFSAGSTKRHLIAIAPWSEAVFDVDLENQQIRTIGCFSGGAHSRTRWSATIGGSTIASTSASFATGDCDATGANGPLNDIIMAQPSESIISIYERLSWTGDEGMMPWGSQGSFSTEMAPLHFGNNLDGGHYPWIIMFGRKQGRMASTGTSDIGIYSWRIAQSYDAPQGPNVSPPNMDQGAMCRAFGIYTQGSIQDWEFQTVAGCFPFGTRPSMWATHGSAQTNYMGLATYSGGTATGSNTDSFDGINANIPTDAALKAFIQSGFGGAVALPEITGDDLDDLVYWIRRPSIGGALVSTPSSFPTRAMFGADVTAPIITVDVGYPQRLSSTSIQVNWHTDKPTYGFVAAGFASGQALTYQSNIGGYTTPFHIWELEPYVPGTTGGVPNSYKTTGHSVTLLRLKASVTTYVVICAKDVAGNNAWSAQMTVP